MTKLLAIRHGETEWNVEGRVMGQLDSRLTARGVEQSMAIARRLQTVPFDALYSSDLGRAVRTADIIGEACGKPVSLDAGLRERHMGIFQALTTAEMYRRFPAERAEYERLGDEYVVPGGESGRDKRERSVRALTAIAVRHPRQTVVVVTHGAFLMGFFEAVLSLPPGRGSTFRRHNASYNAFEYTAGQWRLETWNDISHLDNAGSGEDPTMAERS